MKTLLTIIACGYCLMASAQTPEPAVGKAIYEFTHVRDTTNRAKPYHETMVLLVGRNCSVYKSLDKQLNIEKMQQDMLNQVKNAPNPNALALKIQGQSPTLEEEYYLYPKDKKMLVEENIINYYIVKDTFPVMKWKVKKDTLSIGGLHCQKAITHFKGRDYEAWFCPDLPFKSGPWKLNGLPGLILQANDTKNEVIFKFAGFEDISKQGQTIVPPADDLKASLEEINRLKYTRANDPDAFKKIPKQSGQKASGASNAFDGIDNTKIASIDIKGYSGPNTKVVNNPIELPEK